MRIQLEGAGLGTALGKVLWAPWGGWGSLQHQGLETKACLGVFCFIVSLEQKCGAQREQTGPSVVWQA